MLIQIERTVNTAHMIPVDQLYGAIHGGERNAHKFVITTAPDGVETAVAGTVTAKFLRSDNAAVALEGAVEDGKATVVLSDECYAVPGRFKLSIFVTSGTETMCIYAAIGNSSRTEGTALIDGGEIIENVADLIQSIENALAEIPPTYTAVTTSIADAYSTSKTYAVGDYAWYNGTLYKCTTAITTAESWTAAHWTAANFGNDLSNLKSAINNIYDVVELAGENYRQGFFESDGTFTANTSGWKAYYVPVIPGNTYEIISVGSSNQYNYICEFDSTGTFIKNDGRAGQGTTKVTVGNTTAYLGYALRNSTSISIKPVRSGFDVLRNIIRGDIKDICYDGVFALSSDDFEIGMILATTDGWNYYDNNYRVRTKQGITLKLYKGAIVGLSDYTNARFVIAWKNGANEYRAPGGWNTADFTVTEDGEYILALANNPDTEQESVSALFSLLRIKQASASSNRIVRKPNAFDHVGFSVINHQGYSTIAPNNTLAAFVLSKIKGYNAFETDVRFTADNPPIPVLSHDDDISVRSTGTGNISEMTYAQLLAYDFGVKKNQVYQGTKITTFEEAVVLAKRLSMLICIDLKVLDTLEQANILYNILTKHGMQNNVMWGTDNVSVAKRILSVDDSARIGYIINKNTVTVDDMKGNIKALKTPYNEIIAVAQYGTFSTNAYKTALLTSGCRIFVWALDDYTYFADITDSEYISGVITNTMDYNSLVLNDYSGTYLRSESDYVLPTIEAFTNLVNATLS